jgi:hemolysin D
MKPGKSLAVVPGRELRTNEQLAFLPAALEIVETPPSPIGRAITYTIVALFCFALAWAAFGTVDIVASATGKIVPSGRTKVVQPFEIGVVRAIHVQDGQHVKAGDVLIELDPTSSNADRDHLESDLMASQLEVARLKAAVAQVANPTAVFEPPAGASPALVATARQMLQNQVEEQRAKVGALDQQRAQKEAEEGSYTATIAKLNATIPLLQHRVDIRKYLSDREYGSKLTYLETLTDLVQQQKELAVQESHRREMEAALQGIDQTRAQLDSEYVRTRLGELATAEQKAAGLQQDVIKATERSRLQVLSAPVDGIVQQLAVHTIGAVVTPAQSLLELVPLDSHVEIVANISNHDVGFVHEGQAAEIKVDTFNFTKYGLIHGTVVSVSADAVPLQKSPAESVGGRPTGDTSSEPVGQSLIFPARIALDRATMDIDGREVPLSPGLAVTVEIKTGQRTVLNYLISPLLRFKEESLHER